MLSVIKKVTEFFARFIALLLISQSKSKATFNITKKNCKEYDI